MASGNSVLAIDEGFLKYFVTNLTDIYSKPKESVINILSQADLNKLPLLRIKLYIQLTES